MNNFLITDEEKQLILKRRELADKRQKSRDLPPKNAAKAVQPQPKQNNRPAGWDDHNDPCKVHKGRITEGHPLFWFEKEIFSKIGNVEHKNQHKLIRKILGMPVQNLFRDRAYHALSHLDCLWEQGMLPLKHKKRYEDYKKLHNIGDDNVHPDHKKDKPDYDFPVANKKRPWDEKAYGQANEAEEYKNGRKFYYDYDEECSYEYKAS